MKVVDRYPSASIEERPPCEAELSRSTVEQNRKWTARNKGGGAQFRLRTSRQLDQEHCGMNSRYLIDGKYYCRKHAAYYVLDRVAIT